MIKIKNIIIGAGPAGLQLGYFFQKDKLEYVILEQNDKVASFFDKYPHSSNLISINKKYTGKDHVDFNLRHDWNSLLNDENLHFTSYSDEYYPKNTDLVKYMNDFASKFELNIKFNTTVLKINKTKKNKYELEIVDNDGKKITYICEKLIVATGLSKFVKPQIDFKVTTPILHYGEYSKNYFLEEKNLENFKNKSVLIIGNGNSGFELGNLLNKYCSKIAILGKKYKPWALSSHYTGDLRGVYLHFFDTFLLKSLNSITYDFQQSFVKFIFVQDSEDHKYSLKYLCKNCSIEHDYVFNDLVYKWDNIILCTGWEFDSSIFNFNLNMTINKKYPEINYNYESTNNENLFFIGSLMHSRDYKKSSGGFIHGFRYLIKYFYQINYSGKLDIIQIEKNKLDDLVNYMLYKINMSSAMYQMYGQLYDVFYFDNDQFYYINNVTQDILTLTNLNNKLNDIYFTFSLEYGKQITNITEFGDKISKVGHENLAPLLHPILRVYKLKENGYYTKLDEIHFDEDLFTNFISNALYKEKLKRTLKMFL